MGRTTFQKIAYFATEVGIDTDLKHVRASYGPWAPGLKRMESVLINNGLIVQRPGRQMLAMMVGPTYDAARLAYARDLARWEAGIEAVADLFLRMTTRQAEIAATVHFVFKELAASKDTTPSDREILAGVLYWKQRRRPPIQEREVIDMIRALTMLGWIEVKFTGLVDSDDAEVALQA